jgi:hypothetical protein
MLLLGLAALADTLIGDQTAAPHTLHGLLTNTLAHLHLLLTVGMVDIMATATEQVELVALLMEPQVVGITLTVEQTV